MENKNYWEKLAQKKGKISTSPDIGCDILENFFIKKYLSKSDNILDLGSGDGVATLKFAKKVKQVTALEISPTLIKLAKKRQSKTKIKNINWHNGSVTDSVKQFGANRFEKIITKRVLINLKSWQQQKEAITQIAQMLKPRKMYLLAEGFTDTFKNLQELRVKFGLEKDHVVDFNLYFERDRFVRFIKKYFDIIEQNNFGIYYFLSHFFYPLVIKPQKPKYESQINQIATQIAICEKLLEEYGYINFYALRRKT